MVNKELELLLKTIHKAEVTTEEEFANFMHFASVSEKLQSLFFELRNSDGDILGEFTLYIDDFSENLDDEKDLEKAAYDYLKMGNTIGLYYFSYNSDKNNLIIKLIEDIKINSSRKDYIIFDYTMYDTPCFYISKEKIEDECGYCVKVEDFIDEIFKNKILEDQMKGNKILENLETDGMKLIIEGLRRSIECEDNLHLVYDTDGDLSLEYDFNNNGVIKNDLFNFGNCQNGIEDEYSGIHEFLLSIGETEIEDFYEWFNNECCFEGDTVNIYEGIENAFQQKMQLNEVAAKLHVLSDLCQDVSDLKYELLNYIDDELFIAEAREEGQRINDLYEFRRTIKSIMSKYY